MGFFSELFESKERRVLESYFFHSIFLRHGLGVQGKEERLLRNKLAPLFAEYYRRWKTRDEGADFESLFEEYIDDIRDEIRHASYEA